ncbi:hypothetical protein Pla110_40880 [Polystyrenella longa]|uniref:Alpha glucuronidase N-terminal domain-containing protein n=1 Tax=Polystyrenella longa TaxID=2528007 RepID=A0A518CSX7_9PLAN|nr:DUF4838 domain-containing protein [Polystyrenella longa]QDU82333.1 hypothetical protein Pla110_40880 [Polystyrenella longa]
MKMLILLFLLSPSILTAAEPQRLSDYRRVVIPDEALAVQKAAAEELSNYVGQITQQSIAIVSWSEFDPAEEGLTFFVGESVAEDVLEVELTPWKLEEWLLKTVPQGVVIAGDDRLGNPWSNVTAAGSMLATYTLLDDHLGVHWFWPGEFGEHVPINSELTLPEFDIRKKPTFEIRSVGLGYPSTYHTKTYNDAARRWSRRNRLGWVRSAVFGHSWYDAFDFRTDESFEQHPEWFALVGGKRRPPQMCTTNPEVIDHMVEYVLNGKQQIMNISPSDGGGFCQCERCKALDVPGIMSYDGKTVQLSDRIFTYANEVARRVREQNPDKGCGMFAYTYYNRPPVNIEKLEPNLYLSFVYQSAGHRDPENLNEWRDKVDSWKKLGAKMVVREGWGNHYYHDMHLLHQNQIISNLAEAHEKGFVAAYGEGSKNFSAMAPNYWALTRMMWDPARDQTNLMDEFYESAYGPVAEEMQAFFETYSDALDENWHLRDRHIDASGIAYANVIAAWDRLIPPETVDAAEEHLKAAEANVPPGEYADRVRFHRHGQDYTRVMLELLTLYREVAILGLKMDFFSTVKKERRDDPAALEMLLKRANELGERREELLLSHRDWAGPDEGLYAFTNDRGLRRWHTRVKDALGIDKPTALTKELLNAEK